MTMAITNKIFPNLNPKLGPKLKKGRHTLSCLFIFLIEPVPF